MFINHVLLALFRRHKDSKHRPSSFKASFNKETSFLMLRTIQPSPLDNARVK